MNKKLLMAVAVAGALAVPGVALAAGGSNVTISGIFKMGFGQYKMSGGTVNRNNSTQTAVVDNSSRIIFGVTEDLGNGLSAIAKLDLRYQPDGGGLAGSGNDYVGLKSKTWGTLALGRYDLHYGRLADETASKAGALQGAAIGLMDNMPNAAGANVAIANTTRTPNVVNYDSINWNGFSFKVAYSTNPFGGENDSAIIAAGAPTTRTGQAWNFNPVYQNGPWKIGYSYWDAKGDNPGATTLDQRGDTVYGGYNFGNGFRLGLGYNRSRLNNAIGGGKNAERTAWSLPMFYSWGPHTIGGHYTAAGDISSDTPSAAGYGNTGADMFAVFYNYDLSKRTAVGLTYAKINNDSGAAYRFFTSTGALGTPDNTPAAGEDPQMWQMVVRHAF
jgi:predicted porin